MFIKRIDHVQLSMPEGCEDRARGFYVDILGFREVAKPAELAGRGGLWLKGGDVKLHLGVEGGFQPARKAHPALVVERLDAFAGKLRDAGYPVREDIPVEGFKRFFSEDCFGNRLEFLQQGQEGE